MSFGFPARHEEAHGYNIHPDYLAPVVGQAIATLGWRAIAYSPYVLEVKFPFSLLSYGEKMTITIYQDGTIHADSRCVFVLQWFDYGKNKKNVTQFFYQVAAVSGYQPLS